MACHPRGSSLLLFLFFMACALLHPPPTKCISFNLTKVVSHDIVERLLVRIFWRTAAHTRSERQWLRWAEPQTTPWDGDSSPPWGLFLCSLWGRTLLTPKLSVPNYDLWPLPLFSWGISFWDRSIWSLLHSIQAASASLQSLLTC